MKSDPIEPLSLDESEVRRLIRVLSDALTHDDGRAPKVNRLMASLCEWVDADGWFWVRSKIPPDGGVPENYDFLFGGGLDERHLALYAERSLEVHRVPPENTALRELMTQRSEFTVSRGQVVPDSVWMEQVNQDYVRQMGHDGLIFSVRQLRGQDSEGLISYVLILRREGKPQFTPREARLVHAIISECGPLHADGLNLTIADDVAALTPRQRTVLALLIDGRSVKEIATHLALSSHTVNDHCKAIYRCFGVSSRAELLARFMHKA